MRLTNSRATTTKHFLKYKLYAKKGEKLNNIKCSVKITRDRKSVEDKIRTNIRAMQRKHLTYGKC